MKTQYALKFDKLIISMIVNKETPCFKKESALYDFHQNSNTYYDRLCDALYLVSVGRSDHSLWISQSGEAKLIAKPELKDGLLLVPSSSIPRFEDDLVAQLESVFSLMEKQIQKCVS